MEPVCNIKTVHYVVFHLNMSPTALSRITNRVSDFDVSRDKERQILAYAPFGYVEFSPDYSAGVWSKEKRCYASWKSSDFIKSLVAQKCKQFIIDPSLNKKNYTTCFLVINSLESLNKFYRWIKKLWIKHNLATQTELVFVGDILSKDLLEKLSFYPVYDNRYTFKPKC